jgi:hypothetical protein
MKYNINKNKSNFVNKNITNKKKYFLTKLLKVLLMALGVPLPVAEKIAPIILKIIFIIIGFIILFLFVFLILFSSNKDDIKPNEYFRSTDKQITTTLVNASSKYNIPSRILLAIAGVQTNYGRYSPYDNIDRYPTGINGVISEKTEKPLEGITPSVFPIVTPNIGAPNTEGLGIFLLKFGPASRANIDPQNVNESAEYLAKLMRDKANELKQNGVKEPNKNEKDTSVIDDFWSKVVASLPLVDPLYNICDKINKNMSLDILISQSLTCELDQVDKINFLNYDTKTQTYYYDSSIKNSDVLIEETLRVAWYWAKKQNKEISSWKDIDKIPCNNSKKTAGVIPLSKDNATRIGVVNRCDRENLVKLFAKHLVKKHTTETIPTVPQKGIYKNTIIGWDIVPWALGNTKLYNEFIDNGSEAEFEPNETCKNISLLFLKELSKDSSLVDSILNNENTLTYYDQYFLQDKIINPINDINCFSNSGKVSNNLWKAHLYNLSESLLISMQEDNFTDNNLSAILGFVVNDYDEFEESNSAQGGFNSLIPRFSSRILTYETIDNNFNKFLTSELSLWARVSSEIAKLGGISKFDPRAGNFFIGTSFTIAIERVNFINYPVFQRRQDSQLISGGDCGGGAETTITPIYNIRWGKFCQNIKDSNLKVTAVSSWRDSKTQDWLFKNNPAGSAAKVSNHQRGIAVDVRLGQFQTKDSPTDWDYVGSANETFRFTHAIKGCLDIKNKIYTSLEKEYSPEEYINASGSPCRPNLIPIKRMQLFGLVPLCKGRSESWASKDVILCDPKTKMAGQTQTREAWHLELGEIFLQVELKSNCGVSVIDTGNKQNVAVNIKDIWLCELNAAGFNSLTVDSGPNYMAENYFENLAQQISSEAVVVAYCESSLNYNSGGDGKYQGLFQLGEDEVVKYGDNTNRLDAINNIRAAARYFVASYKNNHGKGWAGWGPWAVVNTNYYKTNPNVLVPIIGRFKSTNPERLNQYGPDLPKWAIDPGTLWGKGPSQSCLDIYKGDSWK